MKHNLNRLLEDEGLTEEEKRMEIIHYAEEELEHALLDAFVFVRTNDLACDVGAYEEWQKELRWVFTTAQQLANLKAFDKDLSALIGAAKQWNSDNG
jgi:hypothetical protein